MPTSPGTIPEAAPSEVGWPINHSFDNQPREHAGRSGDEGVGECLDGNAVGGKGRTGVEPEPTEPEDPGADHGEREVVRQHRFLLPTAPGSEHYRQRQRGCTGGHVHHCAAGEVEAAANGEPADVGAEHPRPGGNEHEQQPQLHERHPGRELHAVGNRSGDQGWGDRGEGEGEEDVSELGAAIIVGDRDVGQEQVVEPADQSVVTSRRPHPAPTSPNGSWSSDPSRHSYDFNGQQLEPLATGKTIGHMPEFKRTRSAHLDAQTS